MKNKYKIKLLPFALILSLSALALNAERKYEDYHSNDTVVHEITTKVINNTDKYLYIRSEAEGVARGSVGLNSYDPFGSGVWLDPKKTSEAKSKLYAATGSTDVYSAPKPVPGYSGADVVRITLDGEKSKGTVGKGMSIEVKADLVKMYYPAAPTFFFGAGKEFTYPFYQYTITVNP